mmetsp:Transcript_18607/g.63406  ORF Transcript_18607/g.63406 Transcript_18607/m.63406 type:complete len:204 (+) Transcript_18607:1838-2449(+)
MRKMGYFQRMRAGAKVLAKASSIPRSSPFSCSSTSSSSSSSGASSSGAGPPSSSPIAFRSFLACFFLNFVTEFSCMSSILSKTKSIQNRLWARCFSYSMMTPGSTMKVRPMLHTILTMVNAPTAVNTGNLELTQKVMKTSSDGMVEYAEVERHRCHVYDSREVTEPLISSASAPDCSHASTKDMADVRIGPMRASSAGIITTP